MTSFFDGNRQRTLDALRSWQAELKERLGQDKTLEQMSTFKDDGNPKGVEYFRLTDSQGAFTGEIRPRDLSHLDGNWHRSVFVLVLDRKGMMLRQQRSETKKVLPGRLDISVGGHHGLEKDPRAAAKKELEEEIF